MTFDSVSLGLGTNKVKGQVAATGLPAGVTLVGSDAEVEIEITGPGSEEAVTPPEENDPAQDGEAQDTDTAPPEEGGDGT